MKVKLGVQRVMVICTIEEQASLAVLGVPDDPADQGEQGEHDRQGDRRVQVLGAEDAPEVRGGQGQAGSNAQGDACAKVEKESGS